MMETIDMSDIGALIKQLRTERNWTQADIANRLWIDSQKVDELEHGADMSFVDVVSVLDLLGATIFIRLPDEKED